MFFLHPGSLAALVHSSPVKYLSSSSTLKLPSSVEGIPYRNWEEGIYSSKCHRLPYIRIQISDNCRTVQLQSHLQLC